MISTQRLIIMLFMIGFLIGVLNDVYENPHEYLMTSLLGETDTVNVYEQDVKSEDGTWSNIKGSAERQQEPHVMNPITAGWRIMKLFWSGLNPLSINPYQFRTTVEKSIAALVMVLRSLLSILLMIEMYMFYINKKTS